MIDEQLIAQETLNLTTSVLSKQFTLAPGLFLLKNVFSQSALDKLKIFLDNLPEDKWEVVEGVRNKSRRKFRWESDSIVEELHTAFENITPIIDNLVVEPTVRFLGMHIWRDTAGYNIDYHTDNPVIVMSAQVYLFDLTPPACGTTFDFDGQHIEIPYIHNSGYLYNNTIKIPHKSSKITPKDAVRYSIYAVWSRA
jgi:hypothetical protein